MNETKKVDWFSMLMIVGLLFVCVVYARNYDKSWKEAQELKVEVERLTNELETSNIMHEEEVNLLTEDNNSLYLEIAEVREQNKQLIEEIETLREEIARLEIAAETLSSMMESEPVNNYAIIDMTDEERDLLARILALEAHDQPDVGQRAVVEVVFNRILTGWASTVKGVLLQSGQFSTVKYLDKPYALPDGNEYKNIDYVLSRGSTILPPDYVYFATYEANGKDFLQIQDHYFAREK